MKKGDLVVVEAPGNYANSQLNGTLGEVVFVGEYETNVLLSSGPSAGVEWQFNPAHIKRANTGCRGRGARLLRSALPKQ